MTTRYFYKILKDHGRVLTPKNKDVYLDRHVQINLPFFGAENCGHVVMGLFYEIMTEGLFGGQLKDSVVLSGNGDVIRPDVIDHPNKLAFESKAVRQGHQLNLIDGQIKKYRVFQIRHPKYRVYFIMYRHGKEAIKSSKEAVEEIEKQLANRTRAAVLLPFSLVVRMWETQLRYENSGGWPDLTRIGSKLINEYLFRPSWAIDHVKADPKDYMWTRYITPEDFTVCHQKVAPFPFIWVKDRNHTKWANEYVGNVPF